MMMTTMQTWGCKKATRTHNDNVAQVIYGLRGESLAPLPRAYVISTGETNARRFRSGRRRGRRAQFRAGLGARCSVWSLGCLWARHSTLQSRDTRHWPSRPLSHAQLPLTWDWPLGERAKQRDGAAKLALMTPNWAPEAR